MRMLLAAVALLALHVKGGEARIQSLDVIELRSAWE